MIRLPLHLKQMGEAASCGHRSGWPYVMDFLKESTTPDGILLDDFVERTFQQARFPKPWLEPWVGIYHHPPNLPEWFDPTAPPEAIFKTPAFQHSLPNLKGCIALSSYLADWLEETLQLPSIALRHPTETVSQGWSPAAWADGARYLVQVGWYLRNYRAIYQVPVPDSITKVHLIQDMPWVVRAWGNTNTHAPTRNRPDIGDVKKASRLSDASYDALLQQCVVFLELFDTSANNAVIECVARRTPIVVNRHPAVEEYLGQDYPLFYDDIRQVPELLTEPQIMAAHAWLATMPRDWLSGDLFSRKLLDFIGKVQ